MDTQALAFTKEALWLVLLLSGPPIAAATVVGLVTAIAQAVTQIQEQTVQHLLKLIAMVVALLVTAPLLGGALYHFADRLFLGFPQWVR
jgi:type III secretion protein S